MGTSSTSHMKTRRGDHAAHQSRHHEHRTAATRIEKVRVGPWPETTGCTENAAHAATSKRRATLCVLRPALRENQGYDVGYEIANEDHVSYLT